MASLPFSSPLPTLNSRLLRLCAENSHHVPSVPLHFKPLRPAAISPKTRTLGVITFALAESDSPKSLDGGDDGEEPLLPLLQELAESLNLPPDYLAKLPGDLRLDLNDAAFDLANGPVMNECGEELGEMLLNLSRAWEKADTLTSNSIARQIPSLESSLTGSAKSAFGRRLVASGRRFESMGQYGQGELQKIAKAMIKSGKILSRSAVTKIDDKPKNEARMLKFGELQVALTPEKANIGAAIAFVFGFLSWGLTQGIQSIPESSMQYANDNAPLLSKSLSGALLVLGYSSTALSAFASIGLVVLGRQLASESQSEEL